MKAGWTEANRPGPDGLRFLARLWRNGVKREDNDMKLAKVFFLAGLFFCLTAQTGIAGEPGSALKADDIKAEPFRDAKTVGKLAAGAKVLIEKRDGGWLMISSPKKGWVKMLSIRRGSSSTAGVRASGIVALASGRAGTGKVVSTTGVRGLNEEDLKNAKFDEKELALDESYAASKDDAVRFAAKAKLKARSVDYLPE